MFKRKNPIYSDYEGGNFFEKKLLKRYQPLAEGISADYPMDKDRGITFIEANAEKTIIFVDNLIVALAIYYDLSQTPSPKKFSDIRYYGKRKGYVVRAFKDEAQMYKAGYGKKVIFSTPKLKDDIILFVDRFGRAKK